MAIISLTEFGLDQVSYFNFGFQPHFCNCDLLDPNKIILILINVCGERR